jgi:hypothetical protein
LRLASPVLDTVTGESSAPMATAHIKIPSIITHKEFFIKRLIMGTIQSAMKKNIRRCSSWAPTWQLRRT